MENRNDEIENESNRSLKNEERCVYPGLLESLYLFDPATVFERLRSEISLVSTSGKSFGKFEGKSGIELNREIRHTDDDPS